MSFCRPSRGVASFARVRPPLILAAHATRSHARYPAHHVHRHIATSSPATSSVAAPNHPHVAVSAATIPPMATSVQDIAPDNLRPYQNRPTSDLITSLVVFQLCAMPWLVKASPALLDLAEKMHMNKLAYAVIKRTFFKHFCGGEDLKEVVPTMETFKKAKVGSILDLALEADVDEASLMGAAAHEQGKKVAQQFREGIDIASQTSGSFIAIKITALLPVSILLSWSNTILLLQKAFKEADKNKDGKVTLAEFSATLPPIFPGLAGDAGQKLFKQADRDNDGAVDWIDMTDIFSLYNEAAARALVREPLKPATADNPLVTSEELDTVKLIIPEIDSIGEHAREKHVRLMVDAEQTYFQPAVDDVGLNLCKRFNNPIKTNNNSTTTLPGPLFYNTYQLYLRDAYDRMVIDIERAERNKYAFGIKIVRGAYMHSERERAEAIGISDPIQPTLAATHAAYNAAIDYLIQKIAPFASQSPSASSPSPSSPPPSPATSRSTKVRPLSFVVASHNANSIIHARNAMTAHNIPPTEGSVAFAQLMGMQDGTTYALATNGYKAFKYIPYGPIEVTIPYLQRRALENADVLKGEGGIVQDRRNIINELKHRMPGFRAAAIA
ncbi:FAD-linked oxidoreductase-like protein [Powellomyces hirtus]|nr:FAD-linked oxidoreductase-like protein [Powellomyces hirtus]